MLFFHKMAVPPPKLPERKGEPKQAFEIVCRRAPGQRSAQISVLYLKLVQPLFLVWAIELGFNGLGLPQIIIGMVLPGRFYFTSRCQRLQRKFANHFQHGKARIACCRLNALDQAMVEQRGQRIERT